MPLVARYDPLDWCVSHRFTEVYREGTRTPIAVFCTRCNYYKATAEQTNENAEIARLKARLGIT